MCYITLNRLGISLASVIGGPVEVRNGVHLILLLPVSEDMLEPMTRLMKVISQSGEVPHQEE